MNSTQTFHQTKAQTTRSRRAKAGRYATPTELAAYRKTISRGGDANLTPADVALLATCRWLPPSVQRHYQEMAAAQ